MQISLTINGRTYQRLAPAGMTLLDYIRAAGILSVKRGCDTLNCGLCTVWVDGTPVLSCSYPAARAQGRQVTTLEGAGEQVAVLGDCLAAIGADQCGYCSPGFMMTVIAMKRTLENPTEADMRRYLVGNLCRCTGYASQMEAVRRYMEVPL